MVRGIIGLILGPFQVVRLLLGCLGVIGPIMGCLGGCMGFILELF